MEIIKFEVGIADGKFFIRILEQAEWTRSNGTGVKTFNASNGYKIESIQYPELVHYQDRVFLRGCDKSKDNYYIAVNTIDELKCIFEALAEWANAMKNDEEARAAWGYKELSPKVEPKPSTATIVYEF